MSIASSLAGFFARVVGPRGVVLPPPQLARGNRKDSRPNPMPPVFSITRWQLSDLERALQLADTGDLSLAAQLWKACRRDGFIAGLLSTRCDALVQLPRRFSGENSGLALTASDKFFTFCPSHELSMMVSDGIGLGVAVAERVLERGADVGVLRRLDPQFLVYRWNEHRWYYRTLSGFEPIVPGDGRWVLHVPGGAVTPWQNSAWFALGRAYISKEHAFYLRENYSTKLANAARVAYSPQAATEDQRRGFFSRLANWGANPVFDLPPGWEVKLLESNGRGYEVFQDTIETANKEAMVTITGNTVTTDGGAGFQNSAIHATIRSDIIQSDGDGVAQTVNEQVLPHWANETNGFWGVLKCPSLKWDTTPTKDQASEANTIGALGNSVKAANEALAPAGLRVDTRELCIRYGIPVVDLTPSPAPLTLPAGTT
jgi:Protein of unknown function (DUF935)